MMRFYRALLRLYPASFRAEYEDEMCAVFEGRARQVDGRFARARTAAAAIADVVPNAAAVHWDLLRQDLRVTARALRRAPGFAITAVLVVALGVGANTAAFSLTDFVLVRPLPFREPDRLVSLYQQTPGYGYMELSPANYRDWIRMSRAFQGIEAYTMRAANLTGGGEPRRLETARVTPGLLRLLGVGAYSGRVFTSDDSVSSAVAVLGYGLWQSEFGGAGNVVGQTIRLDGVPHTVVGVMPPWFSYPNPDTDLWTPLVLAGDDFEDRNNNYLYGVGRLRDGVTLEQARADLETVTRALERQYPRENERTRARVMGLRDSFSERARLLVIALVGASLCVLVLACANLASLLLARAAQRAPELAVRAALGAGRERLVRQLLTESLVLALAGGAAGVALAAAGVPLLARLVPSGLPLAGQPTVDGRALAVAALLVLATGLGFGVWPAFRAARASALGALRSGVRSIAQTQRARAALVVVEVAASVVLLISSGLLMRAVWRIGAVDPGFRAEHVLALRTALPLPEYDSTAKRVQFYDRVLADVRALPGVERAAYVSGLPMVMRGGIWPVSLTGDAAALRDAATSASLRFVSPGYFATLGIPLRDGRDVAVADTREQPFVAVVSESFAERYWPGERAIGKRFTFAFDERTIVGVVGDVRTRGLERTSEPQVYLPYGQVADGSLSGYVPRDLVVRSEAPASALLPAIRRAVRRADPDQPISDVRALPDVVGDETAPRLTQLRLLATLATIALLIAGVGLHGLLAFAVSNRLRELGVRRALGAQSGRILALVLREGLALAAAGVVIGVAIAYAAARGMSALLAGVRPGDPATFAAAAALCLAMAVAGCLRPALRAARVDPATALRAV